MKKANFKFSCHMSLLPKVDVCGLDIKIKPHALQLLKSSKKSKILECFEMLPEICYFRTSKLSKPVQRIMEEAQLYSRAVVTSGS